jgi:hypothetical protein
MYIGANTSITRSYWQALTSVYSDFSINQPVVHSSSFSLYGNGAYSTVTDEMTFSESYSSVKIEY